MGLSVFVATGISSLGPYFGGAMSDLVLANMDDACSTSNPTMPMYESEKKFYGIQWASVGALFLLMLAGVFYAISALYVVRDIEKAEEEECNQAQS